MADYRSNDPMTSVSAAILNRKGRARQTALILAAHYYANEPLTGEGAMFAANLEPCSSAWHRTTDLTKMGLLLPFNGPLGINRSGAKAQRFVLKHATRAYLDTQAAIGTERVTNAILVMSKRTVANDDKSTNASRLEAAWERASKHDQFAFINKMAYRLPQDERRALAERLSGSRLWLHRPREPLQI